MNEEIYQRLTKVETKIEEHSHLLLKQQEKNELQTELNTILKLNAEQMKKFGDTLNNIDKSLNNLNNIQQQMKEEMSEINTRVSDIESYQEDGKINTLSLVKSILSYILTAAGGLVVGYIALKFGLK